LIANDRPSLEVESHQAGSFCFQSVQRNCLHTALRQGFFRRWQARKNFDPFHRAAGSSFFQIVSDFDRTADFLNATGRVRWAGLNPRDGHRLK